jgi:hypothetical protein
MSDDCSLSESRPSGEEVARQVCTDEKSWRPI